MTPKPNTNAKQKILTTATTLFAQQGFDATGIDQIAKTAGITKSLIYYYFKSKDDLLATIFQNFIEKSVAMKTAIMQALAAHPAPPPVDRILKAYTLPFLTEHKDVIKIAFAESLKETATAPHLNIFRYLDQNFQASLVLSETADLKPAPTFSQSERFFLFLVPLFAFIVFSDEWCEYYQCDLTTATDMFVQAYAQMYQALSKPLAPKPNPSTI